MEKQRTWGDPKLMFANGYFVERYDLLDDRMSGLCCLDTERINEATTTNGGVWAMMLAFGVLARFGVVAAAVLGATGALAATGWINTSPHVFPRASHATTMLTDGSVLVSGGFGFTSITSSTEVYNPAARTWSETASLNSTRRYHTSQLLPNGQVLVIGGVKASLNDVVTTCEIYNSAANSWTETTPLVTGRFRHASGLLPDGRVLAVGGEGTSRVVALRSGEIYDPATGVWSAIPDLSHARRSHTATVLNDGKVLVAGGNDFTTGNLTAAEVYDPVFNTWTSGGMLTSGRSLHTAVRLLNGEVIVCGGQNGRDLLRSCEIYSPLTNSWRAAADMQTSRSQHASLVLPDGKVLVAGGTRFTAPDPFCEVYDPSTDSWSTTASLAFSRREFALVQLPNGAVLAAGGQAPNQSIPVTSELLLTDTVAPESSAFIVGDKTRVAVTTLPVSFTATDNPSGSGVAQTKLYAQAPGSTLLATGLTLTGSSGTFNYTPTGGNGKYRFATRAVDKLGNAEPVPIAAQATVVYNSTGNGTFMHVISSPSETLVFPMTDDLDVTISLTNATPGGEIAVERNTPRQAPPVNFGHPENLLNESLTITGTNVGSFTAALEWQYESQNLPAAGTVDKVFRCVDGDLVQTLNATNAGGVVSVNGITGFSTWYAGSEAALPAAVSLWTLE